MWLPTLLYMCYRVTYENEIWDIGELTVENNILTQEPEYSVIHIIKGCMVIFFSKFSVREFIYLSSPEIMTYLLIFYRSKSPEICPWKFVSQTQFLLHLNTKYSMVDFLPQCMASVSQGAYSSHSIAWLEADRKIGVAHCTVIRVQAMSMFHFLLLRPKALRENQTLYHSI